MANPTKPYELTFEERNGYLYAHVTAGTITEEIAMSYLHEVAKRCTKIKCSKLMLDRDIPAMLPDGTLFFVAKDFQELIGGIKTAFINPYLVNDDAMEFAITVGSNRGGDYGVFHNAADAEAWLLK